MEILSIHETLTRKIKRQSRMTAFTRRALKTILFIALVFLSIRYVHTYPVPMTKDQVTLLFRLSDALSIRDPEDLYISAMMVIELITAILAYLLIIKLWRYYHTSRSTRQPSSK
ncbi:hypothetical protein OHJ28_02485 [Dickeya fangzhongdai]|uniref:hypothetical protein n=1 Tax=Dickeya fangzhongdai TaxID=1778540 RepID=UPI0023E46C6A|nr:hypothetical protein [Dickeya fangzhongdai]WES90704.1 hypothetical protein PQ617_09480 [Dickeya fangzhongdai]